MLLVWNFFFFKCLIFKDWLCTKLSGLLKVDASDRRQISVHLFSHSSAPIVQPDLLRFCRRLYAHKRTIENTDRGLEMLLFIPAWKSLIAVWLIRVLIQIDTALWEAMRWTSARESLFFFFLPFHPSQFFSLLLFLSSAKRKSQLCFATVVSPPQKGWCDCRAFQRAQTRALSEDPLLHLLSAFLSTLCCCGEKPVSSAVRWRKDVVVSALFSPPLCLHIHHYCLTSCLNSENSPKWQLTVTFRALLKYSQLLNLFTYRRAATTKVNVSQDIFFMWGCKVVLVQSVWIENVNCQCLFYILYLI